jgi:hypothetical protein
MDFVPENDRVAVFDNDGTLWCETPLRAAKRDAGAGARPGLDFSNGTAGKPVAINKHIGRLSSITPMPSGLTGQPVCSSRP